MGRGVAERPHTLAHCERGCDPPRMERPLCPRRTTASQLLSTLSVCDPRIKVDQLPAALPGSVLFTRLLSMESGNIHFYRAVRQHTDRIISIRLACLSAARTRGTSLAAPFRIIFFPEFFLTRTPGRGHGAAPLGRTAVAISAAGEGEMRANAPYIRGGRDAQDRDGRHVQECKRTRAHEGLRGASGEGCATGRRGTVGPPAATEAAAQWCLILLQASVRVACAGG